MKAACKSLPWLIEEDGSGISYLVLKNLVGLTASDLKVVKAKNVAYTKGHIGRILVHMNPDGYWRNPKGGYSPKYYSTVWALILLSQLGASLDDDPRIKTACNYYLDHAYSKDKSISHNGTPSGTFDCLQGNMCAALIDLGFADERLDQTLQWMANSEIGKIDKYYSIKCGPHFACGANGKQPCAWGAVKVMLALGKIPQKKRSLAVKQAIQRGVDFLLGIEPMTAAYPTVQNAKPNGSWWKLGFPTFYCTDLLQLTEALVTLGFEHDPRMAKTVHFIESKQDDRGRWNLEHDYNGKTWGNFGEKGKPNKWVTYRALKVLKSKYTFLV